jgi:drug/metabolite transporter (DMT)-like permease
MTTASNAIARAPVTRSALWWGLVGVLGFSFSLPLTRVAVKTLDPTFIGLGRALVAAVFAGALLVLTRQPLPARRDIGRFAAVGLGVVIGFPLFSSLALEHLSSAHTSVIVGLLPAATAAYAVARLGERPPRTFWIAATAGLIAVALGAMGYAEGGALSRTYGGWQVICWALVLTAPFLIIPVALHADDLGAATPVAWLCFLYVALVSMFLAFFAWYHGLALGGVARVGQVQLAQPVITLVWSALLVGERVTGSMVLAALAVVACVGATQRARA